MVPPFIEVSRLLWTLLGVKRRFKILFVCIFCINVMNKLRIFKELKIGVVPKIDFKP